MKGLNNSLKTLDLLEQIIKSKYLKYLKIVQNPVRNHWVYFGQMDGQP